MKLRKQAEDSIETGEAILIEWDDRHKHIGVGIFLQKLQANLPPRVKKMVEAVLCASGCALGQDRW